MRCISGRQVLTEVDSPSERQGDPVIPFSPRRSNIVLRGELYPCVTSNTKKQAKAPSLLAVGSQSDEGKGSSLALFVALQSRGRPVQKAKSTTELLASACGAMAGL